MFYLNKICILCTSSSKLKVLFEKERNITYIKSLFPALEVKQKFPAYICAKCERIITYFFNFKRIGVQNYNNWMNYVDKVKGNYPYSENADLQIRIYKSGESETTEAYIQQHTDTDDSDSENSELNFDDFMSEENGSQEDNNKSTIYCCCGKAYCKASHKLSQIAQYKCNICNSEYRRINRLKLHYSTKHADVENPYTIYWKHQCKLCKMKFTSDFIFREHKKTCILNNKKINSKEYLKNFKCFICNEQFKSEINLNSHMTSHDELKYACFECNKKFKQEKELKIHLKKEHNAGMYQCQFCDRRFFEKGGLLKHRYTHLQKKYQCKSCISCFVMKHQLERHNFVHHETSDNKCPHCNKLFTCRDKLFDHIYTHDRKKSERCKICRQYFSNINVLKKHLRVLHGEKYIGTEA